LQRNYLLDGDKQSAQFQYQNIAALSSLSAQKFYAAIYANLLVAAGK
jgi:hypothetical protein